MLAVALALAGCGSETSEHKAEVERVVRDFAAADNRRACDLLTPNALKDVYGGEHEERAYDTCLERSKRFEGEGIEIDDTDVRGDRAAVVKASTEGEERRFRVTLRNLSGDWLIDEIVEESG